MPTAHGSVAKFLVALTALALITGATMFQALTVRQAKGAAAPAIAISLPVASAPASAMHDADADSDIGPGLAESTLASTQASAPAANRKRSSLSRSDR